MACNISSTLGCNCGYMTNESASGCNCNCNCNCGCGASGGERVVCEWPQGFCCSRKVHDFLTASAAVDESTGLRPGAIGCGCGREREAEERSSRGCGCGREREADERSSRGCGCGREREADERSSRWSRCRCRRRICCRFPF